MAIAILAQAKKDDSGGAVCGIIAIIFVLGGIASLFGNAPIRCKRCGYRAKKREFLGGRCPNCDSLEM
jgi:hypothetical protein